MKSLNLFILLTFSLLAFMLEAQTPKIAHKSHSGTSATFTTEDFNNFGLPPDYTKYIEKQKKIKKHQTLEKKGIQTLKTKEIEPLPIQGKERMKPIEINSSKAQKKSIQSSKEKKASNPKPINRFKVKRGEIKTTESISSQYTNWLWLVLLGAIIIIGILPINSKN